MNCISLKEQKGESKMNCISLKEQKGENKMRRGFTLIELMIVISVMAILIGISLPYFKGMQDEGKSAKAAGELRTLTTGIESYYIHHDNEYPDQADAVNVTIDWQSELVGATPTIVRKELKDAFAPTQEYSYATSAASKSKYYVVFSVGVDGTTTISGIDDANGGILGAPGDDIYISNAESGVGGF